MGIFKLNKIIFLIIIIFTLSGCVATYNIDIKDEKIFEYSQIIIDKQDLDKKEKNGLTLKDDINYTFNSFYDKNTLQEGEKTRNFTLKKIDDENNYGLYYEDSWDLNNYINSPILQQCYKEVNVINYDSILKINTNNYFSCFDYYNYIDEVKIKVKSDYLVLNENSDEVNNNEYIWIINKENYKKKNIIIEIDKTKNANNYLNKEQNKVLINIILIGLGAIIVISGLFIFFKVRNSDN